MVSTALLDSIADLGGNRILDRRVSNCSDIVLDAAARHSYMRLPQNMCLPRSIYIYIV